jgi:ABC-type transport system involved in multi-copper enzyme maturation permease subunit
MTASTIQPRPTSRPWAAPARFAGFRPLVRKELADWRHSQRLFVIPAILIPFMVLTAANAWITATIADNLPPDVAPPALLPMGAMDNLMAAISTQVFILAAIFASMSLLVGERERGTLAWVASKPVARGGIWAAKWSGAVIALGMVAVVVPVASTVVVVIALYGVPDPVAVAGIAVGMVAVIALYVAVALAASTVVRGQAAVAVIGFGLVVLPPIIAAIAPFDVAPFLPTAILAWTAGLATGAPVGIVAPIAWLVVVAVLVAFAVRRLERTEL